MLGKILRYLAVITGPSAAIYGVLLVASLVIYPPHDISRLASDMAGSTFLESPPAYVVYSSTAFARPGKTLVLIGPSNVEIGFTQELLREFLPGVVVHNVGIGGARIDGMAAVVDLVYAQRQPQDREDTVLFFGLWFGEFMQSGRSRDASPVAQQMQRFGLFRKADGGYEVTLMPALFDAAVNALRPFFFIRRLVREDGPLFSWLLGEPGRADVPATPGIACDSEQIVHQQASNPDDVHASQFAELLDVVEEVRRRGGHLVLADLPLPACVTSVSSHWQHYQALKHAYLDRAIKGGALYIDMQDLDADSNFIDATHPSLVGARKWSARLADALIKAGLAAPR